MSHSFESPNTQPRAKCVKWPVFKNGKEKGHLRDEHGTQRVRRKMQSVFPRIFAEAKVKGLLDHKS